METQDLLKLLPQIGDTKDEMASRLRILLKHVLDKLECHEQLLVRKAGKNVNVGSLDMKQEDPLKEKIAPEDAVRGMGAEPVAAAGRQAELLADEQKLRGRNNKPELEAKLAGSPIEGKLSPDEEVEQARKAEQDVKERALEEASKEAEETEAQKHARKVSEQLRDSVQSDEAEEIAEKEAAELESEEEIEAAEVEVEEEESKKKGKKGGLFGSKSSKRK